MLTANFFILATGLSIHFPSYWTVCISNARHVKPKISEQPETTWVEWAFWNTKLIEGMCISWLALLHGLKKKTHSSSKKIMELTFHWWRNLLMHTNMLPSSYVSVFLCTPHFHYMVTRLRPCIGTMMKLYEWIVRGWFMFVCALMFRSVIGYHHFHWMNMNTTHLLFSHTHSSSEHFFSTHMNSGGAL